MQGNDLTGQRFGRLVAVERAKQDKHGNYHWRCICDCGNETIVNANNLRRPNTRSCGCLQKQRASEANSTKLIGRRFGRLVVTEKTDQRKDRIIVWKCLCDCGKTTYVRSTVLLRKQHGTRSCGCLKSETGRKTIKDNGKDWTLPSGQAAKNLLLRIYKRNASSRDLAFALNPEQFFTIVVQDCYYCGRPAHSVKDPGYGTGTFTYSGIDRLHNGEGYTIENAVPCCLDCNMAKRQMTHDEFLSLIELIYMQHILPIKEETDAATDH